MDETTTRRGFLKGLGAVAALLTVAPPLLLEVAADEPLIAATSLHPVPEPGELWLQVANRWRLIGGVRSLSTVQETIEIPTIESSFRSFLPKGRPKLSADIGTEPAAVNLVQEVLYAADPVDMMVAFRDANVVFPRTRISNLAFEIAYPERIFTEADQWRRRLALDPPPPEFVRVSLEASFDKAVHCR
jgi:hypothetical protein